ncbi:MULTISPECIES: aspartate aminotransferase family protein [Streptomyces]|uniref:Aspartate aminotransferase family protein n=2 Tax=Streptomyces rimosus subsp. rimosus TaxID=132474 RepID=L8EGP0_STRR1|nr:MULTISPECIES: aspartate aminotransferase family protein [Streptomyces]KOG80153.1 class III aminotransferase [Kitasatospora aureofaciens]MYT43948.1 aminotransferase class III-fold pyridoxal phosphate-dependent enzyme [Streptomyces sp. SID5471]KEF08448.1 class III aminotransferase [Streptomyces rimosus]KEF20717.1 class III aminotransferase [Streptomyces rimosus]KOT26391.1 class III aminotransferase [Streptomyces rimosus subsp. rimosus]
MTSEASTEARSTGSTLGPDFTSGSGPWLYTEDGTAWFDGTAGSGAATLGHQHPDVIAAVTAQAGRLAHTGCKLGSDARRRLIGRIGALSPYAEPAVLPTTTGAEAVESALKIARAATGHRAVVGFRYGFHGKTAGALGLTWRAEFKTYSGFANDDGRAPVVIAELPDPREPGAGGAAGFAAGLSAALDAADRRGGTAAVILEPVQVTEGVLDVAPELLDEIARQAHSRGALLILDEIYTGLGRAGRLFTAELMTEKPDLTLLGKTLGNGFPVGAVVGERAVVDALPPGVQTSTFSGHPVSCAAAEAVLDVVVREDLAGRAQQLGKRLRADLDALAARHPWMRAVRTTGALAAFDCVRDGRPVPELARAVTGNALRGRLLLFGGGPEGASVKIVPPALLDDDGYRFLIDTLGTAVAEAARNGGLI